MAITSEIFGAMNLRCVKMHERLMSMSKSTTMDMITIRTLVI